VQLRVRWDCRHFFFFKPNQRCIGDISSVTKNQRMFDKMLVLRVLSMLEKS